ncbi:MAG: DUF1573 domain-containing protein [Flavobacteriales bacterium]|nr:DUF1573 domain-containing protein [Flavobacteriales bacterium]
MKKIFLSTVLILSVIISHAQAEPIENLNMPIINFEVEIIDYGTIEQGSNGLREFKFTNTGTSTLIISEAKKSCGCTVPTPPKEPIKPGESSVIKVKYDTKRLGAFNKTVTIISNAERSSIILKIKGVVIAKKLQEDLKANSPIN